MPTYEYACRQCGQHIEVFQRLAEEPLTVCGVCGGQLRKVFHPAGILFKGSGFYSTDNRAKQRTETGASEPSGADSKTDSKKEGTKEPKRESKAPAASDGSRGGGEGKAAGAKPSATGTKERSA
jgi:putative FmdB family regulatory protein